MRGVSQTLANRDVVQTSEAELSIEVFPRRQPECHQDTDMGKYDCMAADAGSQKTGEAQMEPFKSHDRCTYTAQLLCWSIRFPQPSRGAVDKDHRIKATARRWSKATYTLSRNEGA